MRIIKRKFNFQAESSRKGEYYDVDLDKNTCTCVDYKIRRARLKEDCKHLAAVKEKYADETGREGKSLLDYIGKEADALDVMKKFGQKAVEKSKSMGEIIEEKGVLKVLE